MSERDIIREVLCSNPLIKFSVYTHIHSKITIEAGDDIISLLDKMRAHTNSVADQISLDSTIVNEAYGKFWMWTLAAYEITRSMNECRLCFSSDVQSSVSTYKYKIERLRMPFAKQQLKNQPTIMNESEASIYSFRQGDDLIFKINEQEYSARNLIRDFKDMIFSIKEDDILNKMETTAKRK